MTAPPLRFLIALAFGLALTGCAGAPIDKPLPMGPVNTGPGTLTQAREYLQGHWTLLSFEIYPPNHEPIRAAATGTMVYDEFSNMNVDLQLNPEAARLAEQIGIPAPDGAVKTSGRTVIDINSRSISYVLEGQDSFRPPTHPLDMNRPRYWDVKGNTLTLRTKDESGKVVSVSVWEKTK
jgi:hypothetical protein